MPERRLGAHQQPFEPGPRRGLRRCARRDQEQRVPGGVHGGRRGMPGLCHTGPFRPAGARFRTQQPRRGLQSASGGDPLRPPRPYQRRRHADQPGESPGAERQRQVQRNLAEVLRHEEGRRGDERQDEVSRRADARGVTDHLVDRGHQRGQYDEQRGRGGQRGGGQRDAEAGDHPEHHPQQCAGASCVRQTVRVEGAHRPGRGVQDQIQPSQGEQREVGHSQCRHRAECRLVPDVDGAAQSHGAPDRQRPDAHRAPRRGARALPGRPCVLPHTRRLAGVLLVKYSPHPSVRPPGAT